MCSFEAGCHNKEFIKIYPADWLIGVTTNQLNSTQLKTTNQLLVKGENRRKTSWRRGGTQQTQPTYGVEQGRATLVKGVFSSHQPTMQQGTLKDVQLDSFCETSLIPMSLQQF